MQMHGETPICWRCIVRQLPTQYGAAQGRVGRFDDVVPPFAFLRAACGTFVTLSMHFCGGSIWRSPVYYNQG